MQNMPHWDNVFLYIWDVFINHYLHIFFLLISFKHMPIHKGKNVSFYLYILSLHVIKWMECLPVLSSHYRASYTQSPEVLSEHQILFWMIRKGEMLIGIKTDKTPPHIMFIHVLL